MMQKIYKKHFSKTCPKHCSPFTQRDQSRRSDRDLEVPIPYGKHLDTIYNS